MPRRRALPLYMRGRPGALLLATARIPGDSAGAVLGAGHSPRVSHREELRAPLHRLLRTPGVVHGFLAGPANSAGAASSGGLWATRANRVAPSRSTALDRSRLC